MSKTESPVQTMAKYFERMAKQRVKPYPEKLDARGAMILSKFGFDESLGLEGQLCYGLNVSYPEIQKLFLMQVDKDIKEALESVANSLVSLIAARN
jgi:hypothetical protein